MQHVQMVCWNHIFPVKLEAEQNIVFQNYVLAVYDI